MDFKTFFKYMFKYDLLMTIIFNILIPVAFILLILSCIYPVLILLDLCIIPLIYFIYKKKYTTSIKDIKNYDPNYNSYKDPKYSKYIKDDTIEHKPKNYID